MSLLNKHQGLDDMPDQFHDFGTASKSEEILVVPSALRMAKAIERSRRFEIVDYRTYYGREKGAAACIVVDCLNDKVPSRNKYGIKNRERLALVFYHNVGTAPETRALRKDFPTGIHQNAVNEGEPISLCLYDEPWTSTQRHWTAETHLKTILWWLARASTGDLHQATQPLEPFIYSSGVKLVLPPNFDARVTQNDRPELLLFGNDTSVVAVWKSDASEVVLSPKPDLRTIILTLQPMQHANIERLPVTLGMLDQVIIKRGGNLKDPLKDAIRSAVTSGGMTKRTENILLLLNIPLCRIANGSVERVDTLAFLVCSDVCSLGASLGVLNFDKGQKKYFKLVLLGNQKPSESPAWQNIETRSVDVIYSNSIEFARNISGIIAETADFKGVLAGLGSLGSALAETWISEGWGTWTFVDYDKIAPHNIARHTATYTDTGLYKVHAVTRSTSSNYYPGLLKSTAIADSAINFDNSDIVKALTATSLFIDASTTLEVPREISLRDEAPRAMSAFFTPNGADSVLMAEDCDRCIRLDSLEAQYYQAILENGWGRNHLKKHKGDIWVGNGCRDLSAIIPRDLIQLHSALLARKIRFARDQGKALISVFRFTDKRGISVCELEPRPSLSYPMQGWTIVIDLGITEKLEQMREGLLPQETGGVILGFTDQKTKRIYVVDALAAPFDSEESSSSFVRGTNGLLDILKESRRRTAGIVSYLGEWHSHPPGCGAMPSCLDLHLIEYLGHQLAADGQPALMIIVGEEEISFMIKSDL